MFLCAQTHVHPAKHAAVRARLPPVRHEVRLRVRLTQVRRVRHVRVQRLRGRARVHLQAAAQLRELQHRLHALRVVAPRNLVK